MRFFLPALLGALLVLGAATGAVAQAPVAPMFPNVSHDPLYDQETYQRLRDITVTISWNQVELRNVLRDLTLAVRSTYPIRAGINFRFSSSMTPADRSRLVSLQAKGMPVYQVLENLSQQVPFTIEVRQELVLLVPK